MRGFVQSLLLGGNGVKKFQNSRPKYHIRRNAADFSILLGHSNIKVTQQHYNPWVRDRQLQLEADLQRAWNRDPLVLLNSKGPDAETPELTLPN